MTREAMKQALEALDGLSEPYDVLKAQEAIREALAQPEQICGFDVVLDESMPPNTFKLAQPEQEPVAWLIWLHGPAGHFDHKQFAEMEFERRNKEYPDPDRKLLPLYTTPPQRTWVGLTDEEIAEMHNEIKVRLMGTYRTEDIYRAIEAKLKEKNQ